MKRHQLIALASIVLVACVDGGRSSGPSFAISDATHGDAVGRNRFFYWLPPLVPAPSPTGDFNRFASPIVTVCKLVPSGATCALSGGQPILVAQFSMTSGTDGELLQITGQQYHVNWHTDVSHLNPDTVYRIAVTVEGRDYGYADVEVGVNAKELKNVDRNLFVPLVDGRTLPIQFRIEAGASCAGREASCAEAIVDPRVQETVILENDADVRLAFGDFPVGWTNGPQVVRIERIPDGDFGPGEGPLGTAFPQYPLFFHYFTSAPEPFNLPVRIGVCNVQDDPEGDAFHPPHRPGTVLAMGGEGDFRTLPRAPVADVLGTTCFGAEREGSEIGALPHGLGDVAARVGLFAASLLAPRRLEASMLVVDGGMGGSTEFFTPAGTVDTAAAPDLFIPTGTPTVTPSTVAPGGTVQLSAWSIKNRGNVDLNSPTGTVRNGFYLSTDPVITASDVFLTDNFNTNDVLQLGEQFDWGGPTLTIPAGTEPGNYYIGILIDDTGLVTEFDESNNYVSVAITVVGTVVSVGVNDFAIDLSAGRLRNPSGLIGSGSFKDTQVIFGAGFAYGTSATDILLGYDSRNQNSDFDPTEVVVVNVGSSETPHHTTAEVRPGGERAGIRGVTVTQESFAFSNTEDAGYVLLKYTLTNTNAGAVNDVFAGFVVDPDLLFSENQTDDRAAFNHELSVAEVAENDQETHPQVIGIVPITSMETGLNYFAWRNGGSPSDPTTREAWFEFLSLSASGVTVSEGPADVRFVTGVGPFSIDAEATQVVWFALVGGNNRAAFDANVAAARAKVQAGGL